MKKLFIIFLLFSITSLCCKKESTFKELKGEYVYSYYWSDANGIEEKSDYITYTFDKTNKAQSYYCCWSYSNAGGWINALKESHSFTYEWKIDGTTFSEILWKNKYASWYSYTFEFINDYSFKLNGDLYKK